MLERRAPFSDNPQVGVRGQRTGQRILDATYTVLGRTGYHRCSVELITREAGCSRPTFYQYFSGKEAAVAQLASGAARRLQDVVERLKPITDDAGGWQAIRDWMDEFATVYDDHEAIFHNLATAAVSDGDLARQLVAESREYHDAVRDKIVDAEDPTLLGDLLDVLSATLVRTLYDASTLQRSGIGGPRRRLLDAYADVFHRTLFGVRPDVNVHAHRIRPTPGLRLPTAGPEDGSSDGTTRRALMHAGHQVLSESGFHGTTIDAIVERAGVAHGTFYRYFPNKELLAQDLLNEASIKLSVYFGELVTLLSDPSVDRTELRRWLERYTQAQMSEMAILRVWSDAVLVDQDLLADAAPMLEWGRRQLAKPLAARGFPGEEVDAMVLLALVDSLGANERSASALEAAARIIERAFLGI